MSASCQAAAWGSRTTKCDGPVVSTTSGQPLDSRTVTFWLVGACGSPGSLTCEKRRPLTVP